MEHHFHDQPGSLLKASHSVKEEETTGLVESLTSAPMIKAIEPLSDFQRVSKQSEFQIVSKQSQSLTLTQLAQALTERTLQQSVPPSKVSRSATFHTLLRPHQSTKIIPKGELSLPTERTPLRPQELENPSTPNPSPPLKGSVSQVFLLFLLSAILMGLLLFAYDHSIQDGKWQQKWSHTELGILFNRWWMHLDL